MDKMKMETTNKTLENLQKLKKMFPEVITESKDENGEIVAAVNAKKLEQLLSTKVIDGDERYDFTWVGKKQAMIEACKPIRKTLRPCREESVDWENTQNLYIEGDNLDVLKLLQESYLNKVKMIYIDPPYNTGNDSFIYPDDYSTNKDAYDEEVGAIDESGYRMFKNTETNGRFHSSWCSMMYPRLKLARNLLSEDGVIFISIDDHEVENLKKICSELFGAGNFVGLFTLQSNPRGSQNSKYLSYVHEYILMFAKNIDKLNLKGIGKNEDAISEYSLKDENGRMYRLLGLRKRGGAWRREDRPNMFYPVYVNSKTHKISLVKQENTDIEIIPKRPTGELSRWTWGSNKFIEEIDKVVAKKVNRIGEPDAWDVFRKDYIDNDSGEIKTTKVKTIWIEKETNYQNAKNEIKDIFGNSEIFDYPKPTYIVHKLASMIFFDDSDVILDFFTGSASTAHAVMQLNADDGIKRQFVMVQLPEVCDEKSEAYKAGYKNICEIGKERIRRAGKKIVEESGKKDLDIGFRVLKLADGNMKDVYYTPEEYNQKDLADMASNIKDDRTSEDLLYACMLEWGLELSLPHKVQTVAGYNVHIVDDGALVACFDDKISENAIKQIAELQPLRAVFRDSGFAGDAARVNVGEIFKLKSPNTTIKVL